jgi:hypothetical protein
MSPVDDPSPEVNREMIGSELVGATFLISSVKHTCLATNNNALLLLQFGDAGLPCQYVVAHEPYRVNGELCWLNGDYFPFFQYATTADALLEATIALQG